MRHGADDPGLARGLEHLHGLVHGGARRRGRLQGGDGRDGDAAFAGRQGGHAPRDVIDAPAKAPAPATPAPPWASPAIASGVLPRIGMEAMRFRKGVSTSVRALMKGEVAWSNSRVAVGMSPAKSASRPASTAILAWFSCRWIRTRGITASVTARPSPTAPRRSNRATDRPPRSAVPSSPERPLAPLSQPPLGPRAD